MEPIIKRVVDTEWHETAADLLKLSDADWEKLKIPGKLVKAVQERLQQIVAASATSCPSLLEPQAKRPREVTCVHSLGTTLLVFQSQRVTSANRLHTPGHPHSLATSGLLHGRTKTMDMHL